MTISNSQKLLRPGLFAAVLAAGLFAPVFAGAEGTDSVSARIDMLENQTRQLSQTLNSLTGTIDDTGILPPADIGEPVLVAQSRDVAQLNLRLSQIEEQMRVLTGQVEGLQFQMTQFQTLIERMQEDIDFRFGQVSPGLGN